MSAERLTADSRLIAREGVVSRQVEQETVLVLPEQGQVKVLNPVGGLIWSLLDGRRSAAAIAESVCRQFTVEPAQAQADTLAFLEDLLERGLVDLAGDVRAS